MNISITEFKNKIAYKLESDFENYSNKILKQILLETIGITTDHWNDVKKIDPEFAKDIYSRLNQEKLETFKNKIAKKLEDKVNDKLLNATTLEKLVENIFAQIYKDTINEIKKKIYEEYEIKYSELLRTKIDNEIRSQMSNWVNESNISKL
jgi:hypothetical protein